MNTEPDQIRLNKIADTEHEIFALLKQRYSPRIFKDKKIETEQLKQLFEAARWAASSNNLQPWRFIYTLKGSDAFNKAVSCLSDFNKSWASSAPVLMFAVYKKNLKDGRKNFHALHDLGLCLGNMTIQAQYLNIALHHMAGVDLEKAQNVFNVPKEYHISSAIAIGYYGGDIENLPEDLQKSETAERKRVPQEDLVFKNAWKK
ncbi:nitroreductase family protein [Allomuricauda sp. F6463D]|uniref:nitroreductase family protein n=1 Tax=Allomuricauda sp. F6463D TaxID=2926409 RepID=UPI001FF44D04|nr:nitroreductase family protein [Muricauda sp. F6463D]MCK0159173.1 nitroreductase family protein [Muricauda sp. F6463D]